MTKKEQEDAKKRRWMIIIFAVIMVGIMIIVPLATLFNPTSLHNAQTDDTQKTGTFDSIADALKYLPSMASYVRFANLSANEAVTNWSVHNIGHNLPPAYLFDRVPARDAVASFPYPALGLSIVEPQQVIGLTDFGRGYDNESYLKTSINGAELRIARNLYAFSTDTYPTIVGRKDYVAVIDKFMKSSTIADTAYTTYSGLLQQANQSQDTVKFAVAGQSQTLGFGDLYYAGISPISDTTCDYRIVIHLNQTLNESQQQDIAFRWMTGASLYGIDASAPQFKGSYVTLAARGDIENCLEDMRSTNWNFIME